MARMKARTGRRPIEHDTRTQCRRAERSPRPAASPDARMSRRSQDRPASPSRWPQAAARDSAPVPPHCRNRRSTASCGGSCIAGSAAKNACTSSAVAPIRHRLAVGAVGDRAEHLRLRHRLRKHRHEQSDPATRSAHCAAPARPAPPAGAAPRPPAIAPAHPPPADRCRAAAGTGRRAPSP